LRYHFYNESLDNIAHFYVIVVFDADSAFIPLSHFLGIILETLERGNFTGEHDAIVTKQPYLRAA